MRSIFDAQTKQLSRNFYLNILQFDFFLENSMHACIQSGEYKCACVCLCVTKCHIDRMHINLNITNDNKKKIEEELIFSIEFCWAHAIYTVDSTGSSCNAILYLCASLFRVYPFDRSMKLLIINIILMVLLCLSSVSYFLLYIAYLNNHRRLHRKQKNRYVHEKSWKRMQRIQMLSRRERKNQISDRKRMEGRKEKEYVSEIESEWERDSEVCNAWHTVYASFIFFAFATCYFYEYYAIL